MTVSREKFSSQADPAILQAARELAEQQGRQFQSIIEEALSQYLERQKSDRPRPEVLELLGLSMNEFDSLYSKLAQ